MNPFAPAPTVYRSRTWVNALGQTRVVRSYGVRAVGTEADLSRSALVGALYIAAALASDPRIGARLLS